MESNEYQSEFLKTQELMSLTKIPIDYSKSLSFKENYNPNRLRKKSRQLASKSIKATIKYKYSISKNNTIKENLKKNEHNKINQKLLSCGKILRTQSRILNNIHDEILTVKNQYSYRNKGFENLNMDKVCGSSYRKLLKNKNNNNNIINNNNEIRQNDNNGDLQENIKVIKEYTINYDNQICDEKDMKMKLNKENINQDKKYFLSEGDNHINKIESSKNNNIDFNNDKRDDNEIYIISNEEESEKKIKNSLSNDNNNQRKIKNLISQKVNIPFNIKYKLFNSKYNFSPKNKKNSNIFLYNNFNNKKNKFPEENNKTMNKLEFNNKRFGFFNCPNFQNDKSYFNKKMNNLNLYNQCSFQLKKDIFSYKQNLSSRTMSLISRFGNYENEKCIMPPNNLKSIIFKKESEFFDMF